MAKDPKPGGVSRPYPLPTLPGNRFYVEPTDPDEAGTELAFIEDTEDFCQYVFRLSNVVYRGHTDYQSVLIADSYSFGRMLILDGAVQSTEDDEELYHEALVQPALLRHPAPRDVLIVGGGEGAALREVLSHRSVRRATMVDIDREVVELCRQHLPRWHQGAFDDPRVTLVFEDGRKFVEDNDARYDVAIIDIVDMLDNGPAQRLYTRQFYELLKRRLRPDGIVVVQGLEFSFLDSKFHAALARTLRTVFGEVHSYRVPVPSFFSAWGFLIASDWFKPAEWSESEIDRAIAERIGAEWLTHIDGAYLKSLFVLCKETRLMLGLAGPVLEDGVPFIEPPDIDDFEPPLGNFPA